MKKIITSVSILCFFFIGAFAQKSTEATSFTDRIESSQEKLVAIDNSLYSGVKANNIGPTVQSGRIVDVEVDPNNPHIFYAAYASGGLWKTVNNGASFEPLFDHEMVMTIGDIAVNWQTDEIWIGTGEVNSSRSSYAGVGMFYSSDGGKNWEHKGLGDTHHIGKVIIDPTDKKTIYVAALGHLYSDNEERGVFKSSDNGVTWSKVLFISSKVGIVDLIMDSKNPNILYAASWERTRRAWDFQEAGIGSGIHKSTDGGNSWTMISDSNSGFPHTVGTGRIGLSMSYGANNKLVLYALLDNYDRRTPETRTDTGLQKDDFKSMSKDEFSNLADERLETYLKENNFPKKYDVKFVRNKVKNGDVDVADLALYLEDANRLLFDSPVKGAELYSSKDEGKTWTKTHTEYLDRVYNSYGYYFGLVRAAPSNSDIVYVAGVPILKSEDGGKTFDNMSRSNVHADHHALWINPTNSQHIVNGNDGGINISYDGGDHYFKCNSPSVGQFYAINVDNAEPYNVYGGLQDNGVWMGSHRYREGIAWHQSGHYPYKSIMGGDGMQIQIDSRDNETIYTGFQFGNYYRINEKKEEQQYITPKHELGDSPYRWNWQSPILLSSHNQDIVYFGANKLLRSLDQGDNFTAISGDLTRGGRKGDVAYGTLTSISESTLQFGLIYTGSDDGKIYQSDDGGSTWQDISPIKEELWVSRVIASSHDLNTVYASLNGYRSDDFNAYLYKSTDRGATWTDIGSSLFREPINVVLEDPHHSNIIYVGTDHGSYISTDQGKNFQLLSSEIPLVAVHDLKVQARDEDLLVGTHGRSIYKIDLEPIYNSVTSSENIVADSEIKRKTFAFWGTKNWLREFNTPEQEIVVFSRKSGAGEITLYTESGKKLKTTSIEARKGFNYYNDDLTIDIKNEKALRKFLNLSSKVESREDDKIYLQAGNYYYEIKLNGDSKKITLILE